MNLAEQPMLEALLSAREAGGWGGLWLGVYPAVVTDLRDPDQQGRVKIRLPWTPDAAGASAELWARLATLMAGASRGSWFVPDVGDEVLVAFEGGQPLRPWRCRNPCGHYLRQPSSITPYWRNAPAPVIQCCRRKSSASRPPARTPFLAPLPKFTHWWPNLS